MFDTLQIIENNKKRKQHNTTIRFVMNHNLPHLESTTHSEITFSD